MTTLTDHTEPTPSPQEALLCLAVMAEESVVPPAVRTLVEPLLRPETTYQIQSLRDLFNVVREMRFAGEPVAIHGPAFRYFIENLATAEQLLLAVAAFQRVRAAAVHPADALQFADIHARAFNTPSAGMVCLIGIDLMLQDAMANLPPG